MRQMKPGLLGGLVTFGLAASLFGQVASAQPAGGPVGQPGARPERPDDRAPVAKASESYDPTGLPVGSFRFFPALELDEVYNDNIYAVPTSAGKTSSFIQGIKPSLNLKSDWSRHMLNLYATGNFGIYSNDSLNNFWDFSVGGDGRVDIQRDWNFYGGTSFSHLHEDRGSPNSPQTSTLPPNQYNQYVANLGYFQTFNRFSIRLDGRLDNYNYLNPGVGTAGGSIPNYDRNRNEFREAVRVGYEFSPGYQVWARGAFNQRAYMNNPDSLGFYHNSTGFNVVGGVAVDLGGITSFEAFAGYLQQNYVDSRFTTVAAPMFGLIGYWNPMKELWIKPFVRRTVEESALSSTSAYLNTTAGLDVDYYARPNVRVEAHFDYSTANYNQTTTTTTGNRFDQYITARIGFKYLPTRNFWIGPSYQYVSRNSNQPNSNFDQNLVMIRLGAQY